MKCVNTMIGSLPRQSLVRFCRPIPRTRVKRDTTVLRFAALRATQLARAVQPDVGDGREEPY